MNSTTGMLSFDEYVDVLSRFYRIYDENDAYRRYQNGDDVFMLDDPFEDRVLQNIHNSFVSALILAERPKLLQEALDL